MEDVLKDVANSKYAQREFFTLVLAYEVAARFRAEQAVEQFQTKT